MKKRSKKVLFNVCVICMAISICTVIKSLEKPNETNDLSLMNIQALASGETGNSYTCYNIGSVDCPGGTKVKGIISRLTFEF